MTAMTDIRTYVRNSKGQPIGIIIATKSTRPDMKYAIGWSLAHKNLDPFKKEIGLKIAVGRLTAAENDGVEVITAKMPRQVSAMIPKFAERCKRYFK